MNYFLYYLINILALLQLPLFLWIKKGKNFPVKAVTPFMYLVSFGSAYELIVTEILQVTNKYWFYIYLLFEYAVIAYFYYHILDKKYRNTNKIISLFFVLLFLGFLFIITKENQFRIESYLSIYETMAVWVFSYFWIRDLFKDFERENSILNYPTFYFIFGFIVYLSGTIILFLLIQYIERTSGMSKLKLWNLNLFFLLVLRLINYKAIWMGRMKK
ncbi:MAG: hypothetical protein ACI9XR_002247 [Flavobacterium sp.]|jgi:hypothetical protein